MTKPSQTKSSQTKPQLMLVREEMDSQSDLELVEVYLPSLHLASLPIRRSSRIAKVVKDSLSPSSLSRRKKHEVDPSSLEFDSYLKISH